MIIYNGFNVKAIRHVLQTFCILYVIFYTTRDPIMCFIKYQLQMWKAPDLHNTTQKTKDQTTRTPLNITAVM